MYVLYCLVKWEKLCLKQQPVHMAAHSTCSARGHLASDMISYKSAAPAGVLQSVSDFL